jgi:pyruvate dehydrogenase E2 component (dihydrolipoamide acetyltransferase)
VKVGEVIAEIETDKATLDLETAASGTLGKILVQAGTEGVRVGAPIAILLGAGEKLDAGATILAPAAPPPAAAPQSAARPHAAPRVPAAPAPAQTGGRVFATPLARRLARDAGIELTTITGTGPGGRIVKTDVEAARARSGARPGSAAPAARQAGLQPMPWQATTRLPNSNVRKVIARRLLEAKQAIPHYYLTIDVELDALLALRSRANGRPDAGEKLSVNDFVVKAIALALRQVPAANAMWTDEAILRFETVDVSVAVATDGGLMTPVLRDADRKSISATSRELKALAAKARGGKLKPEEFQGGGFTVSNLGMYGIRQFAAIINPPQSAILAVGAAEQRPVVRDGAVTVRTIMTCTLSADHRSVDGAVGAQFLAAFRAYVEEPLSMLF